MHETTQCSLTESRVAVACPFSFYSLITFVIQPADDLLVTSYCVNSSLFTAEEEFHTRDVDSSNWYLQPDHDVTMTLCEVRE